MEYEEPDKQDENIIPRELIPSKRRNCDKKVNPMGEKLIDLCKGHDLQIVNERMTGDSLGVCTFFDTKDGASTIDIAVASDPLYPLIKSFIVFPQNEISKHCKIVLRIKNMKSDIPKEAQSEDNYPWIYLQKNYKWNDTSALNLTRTLNSPELVNEIQ